MKPGVRTRAAAARALMDVTEDGAWSNRVAEVLVGEMPQREKAKTLRLFMDAVRFRRRLDRAINSVISRPLADADPEIRACLRIGAVDLLLHRTPSFAAISTAVEATRELDVGHASSFVNAALRKLDERGEPPIEGEARYEEWGVEAHVFEIVAELLGDDGAASFFEACVEPPSVSCFVAANSDVPLSFVPHPSIKGAGHLEHPSDADPLYIMDAASVAVGRAVGAKPGDRVLDVAAAPGGKTIVIADGMAGEGLLVGADRHWKRLIRSARRWDDLELPIGIVQTDGLNSTFRPGSFDVVLLDAPCSGLGTVRRRPEIKDRITSKNIESLAALQENLLAEALPLVRPGGRLVYSVCTLTKQETVDRVEQYDAAPPEGLPGDPYGKGLLLAPHLTDTDGMFISVISV
jgi:16S rRNA (cytosine967-C5)-methyltransferase